MSTGGRSSLSVADITEQRIPTNMSQVVTLLTSDDAAAFEVLGKVFYGCWGCWLICLSIFRSGSLIVNAAIYPKNRVSTYKIGGKVGLDRKISDFSAKNRNF